MILPDFSSINSPDSTEDIFYFISQYELVVCDIANTERYPFHFRIVILCRGFVIKGIYQKFSYWLSACYFA